MSKYCFLGDSYAATHLREAARRRGLSITDSLSDADLVFVSQDTPTDEHGTRSLYEIRRLLSETSPYPPKKETVPVVVTSQVPPGFCREYGNLYHQAETLRIEDGPQRAMYPEMFIVGAATADETLPDAYCDYLEAFDCPIIRMTWEEAEFAKIAINASLISQVETANMLAAHAEKIGADWGRISRALRHDSRIGKYAYLTPGRWQDSRHLLRDFVTLKAIAESPLLKAWQ